MWKYGNSSIPIRNKMLCVQVAISASGSTAMGEFA